MLIQTMQPVSTVLSPAMNQDHLCVQMESITLKEALKKLDAGEACSMAVITASKKQNKGGEYVKFPMCWKYTQPKKSKISEQSQPVTVSLKNPNHFKNRTRHLRLPNGEIRKIRIRLIRRFNGKTVI